MSVVDDLLMYSFEGEDMRLVIPSTLQAKVTKNLHSAHQGSDAILKRARQCVYWPGMGRDIVQSCASCKICATNAPSQTKENLLPSPIPQYPFQHVVADIFHIDGHDYRVYADRLTGWIEVAYFLTAPKSSDIINILRSYFHTFGVPEEIAMDGGPNISSTEINLFLNEWNTKFRQSSAYYPKSNGRAEAAVKTMKRIINGNTGRNGTLSSDSVTKALLQYYNTPMKTGGKSPAQLLYGRNLRVSIPQMKLGLIVNPKWKCFLRKREKSTINSNDYMKHTHDSSSVRTYDQIPID